MAPRAPGVVELADAAGARSMDRPLQRDFGDWVEEHQRALLGFAQLVSGNRHTAEDLVQVALTRAYARWPRLGRGDQHPEAYVRRIIVNEHTSLWRRPWKRRELASDALPDRPAPDGDPQPDSTWALVQALPARQRAAIALRFYADLSVADTAALMGCSTGSVKSHTSRAIARLRGVLTDEDDDA